MKKMYYLNVWQESLNRGTSLLFKTDNKLEFYEYFKLITEKYKPIKGLVKVTKYSKEDENRIFVSFADNVTVFDMWYMEKPKGLVDLQEIIRLDKLPNYL